MSDEQELVERITEAMVDCHDKEVDRYATYADWIKWEKEDSNQGELARDWMAARRLEAKAALSVLAARIKELEEGNERLRAICIPRESEPGY